MPAPTVEMRITRFIALLDIYDEALAGAVPSAGTLATRLRLSKGSGTTGALREVLADRLRARGIAVPAETPHSRREFVNVPECKPQHLTATEARIYRCLADARGRWVTADELVLRALGYKVAVEANSAVKGHVSNIRKKGYVIASTPDFGYRVPEVAS